MSDISDERPGLFGWVPAPARGQGRPPFVWTREKSNRVMVLFASGHKVRTVAEVMGCDAKTLRKCFSRECANAGRAELVVRSGLMAKLAELTEEGNVGAAKQLDKMIAAERIRVTSERLPASRSEAKASEPKLGKKAAAEAAAKGMVGNFATRKPPGQLFQ